VILVGMQMIGRVGKAETYTFFSLARSMFRYLAEINYIAWAATL
jgi:hypothetical protein